MADESNPVRRSPLDRWLMMIVALFVLAAGALGALWFVERGDHKTTADHVNTARTETQEVKRKLTNKKKSNDDTMASIDKAIQERHQHEAYVATNKPCTDAGRAFAAAGEQAATRAAIRQMAARCK